MKIGIITQHRVRHFGSVLQAYALQRFLFNHGLDNEIIDYVYPNKKHRHVSWKKKIKLFLVSLKRGLKRKDVESSSLNKLSKIEQFIEDGLIKSEEKFESCSALRNNCPKYDVYLTGSDQVWNTQYLRGDTSFFFSWLSKGEKKVSYASSFGKFKLEGRLAKKWLSNLESYRAISVRETNAAKIIKEYTGLSTLVVLDPTLLLDRSDWLTFAELKAPQRKKYVLVYLLTYVWNPIEYAEKLLTQIIANTEYDVIVIEPESITYAHRGWKYVADPSPADFIRLFAEASVIVTNSFHGTAFAVNLQTPFYSILKANRDNDDRIASLLHNVGILEDVNSKSEEDTTIVYFDNFDKIDIKLQQLRENSTKFLLEAIRN